VLPRQNKTARSQDRAGVVVFRLRRDHLTGRSQLVVVVVVVVRTARIIAIYRRFEGGSNLSLWSLLPVRREKVRMRVITERWTNF